MRMLRRSVPNILQYVPCSYQYVIVKYDTITKDSFIVLRFEKKINDNQTPTIILSENVINLQDIAPQVCFISLCFKY